MPTDLGIVPALIITEMTGDQRTLRLVGRALPLRDSYFALSGKMRAEVFWPVGSPVATVQVLGASEEPTTIKGSWKDRFIQTRAETVTVVDEEGETFEIEGDPPAQLDGQPVDNVAALARVVDDIRRKGQLLRVTWGSQGREGVMTQFVQNWIRVHDLDWEITFTWTGFAGEGDAAQSALTKEVDLSDVVREYGAHVDALANAGTDSIDMDLTFSQKIDASVDALQNLVTDGADTVTGLVDGSLAVLDAGRRMAGILSFVQQVGRETVDTLYGKSERSIVAFVEAWDVTVGQAVMAAKAIRDRARAARRARHAAARRQLEVLRTTSPDARSVFVAREGQDLRDVATRFYGAPDGWRTIAAVNGLRGSLLSAGQVVVVPANKGDP